MPANIPQTTPNESTFTTTFYQNLSDKRCLNKKLVVLRESLEGNFREHINVVDPVFVTGDYDWNLYAKCNYIYIKELGRYYFAKLTLLEDWLIEVSCHCDVLCSARDAVNDMTTVIDRQEANLSNFFVDHEYPVQNIQFHQTLLVGSLPSTYNYFLTLNGGEK